MYTHLNPTFLIEKLGYTGVYLIFLFLLQNIDRGYSLELPRNARRTKRTLRVTRKLYYVKFARHSRVTRECLASDAQVTRKTFLEGIKIFGALRDRSKHRDNCTVPSSTPLVVCIYHFSGIRLQYFSKNP